jgi:hypothetical protein
LVRHPCTQAHRRVGKAGQSGMRPTTLSAG